MTITAVKDRWTKIASD